jgi:hypothetical protein
LENTPKCDIDFGHCTITTIVQYETSKKSLQGAFDPNKINGVGTNNLIPSPASSSPALKRELLHRTLLLSLALAAPSYDQTRDFWEQK